ncbi:MAG: hypothetical protein LUQ31_05875 [Methanoregula sp.]|nr:hypothetical protein [Methanoregula sp.]
MVPDNDRGNARRCDTQPRIDLEEQVPVCTVVIDFEMVEPEGWVCGLDTCDEGFYCLAVTAPVTVEVITGNRTV